MATSTAINPKSINPAGVTLLNDEKDKWAGYCEIKRMSGLL